MNKLAKLKNLSIDELCVRGTQAVAAFAERRGWSSLSKLPGEQAAFGLLNSGRIGRELRTAEEFLEHFRTREKPGFFSSFTAPQSTTDELKNRWPASAQEIVERAERIREGRFDLLGFHDLSFGDPIDWRLEPVAGKRTPLVHWSKLNYLDSELAGDKKIIWELNRHQYFATLGQAYWLTNDEGYAQTFVAHLESWMDQNPPKLGINWASSLEVAFRLISWLWAVYFFKTSPQLSAPTFMRAVRFLYMHARHLEIYLSTYFSPNTHLTGEALGLFYVGTLFPEFGEARRWRDKGREIMLGQLEHHVRSDGVYFEQSSYYHRYTADIYTHFLILSHANGETLPDGVETKLKALLDHLMYITRPDGATPLFGDDDGGRLVSLDRRAGNDFRAALSIGAALFERPDYKFVAGVQAEETLWLLGPSGLKKLDSIQAKEPDATSVGFETGGYYVMRDGWTPDANYLLFDCGPHGTLNCGHAHADALSFELAVQGRTLLIDPGTYTYTGSQMWRDWFRSSLAHNTLTIDRQSSSVPGGPFSWRTAARCEAVKWVSRDRFDFIEGRHDGYARLPRPVVHARSILFLKHDYWIILDQVTANGDHQTDLWFHFDSGANPMLEVLDDSMVALSERDSKGVMDIQAFATGGQWRREEGWVSHCYGERASARVYAFSAPAKGDTVLLTFLLPQPPAPAARSRVSEVEAIGGKAFAVTHENGVDVVMIRDDQARQRVEMERLASDFKWTWARFADNNAKSPTELIGLDGAVLELEGKQILAAPHRLGYFVASRAADKVRVETDGRTLDVHLPLDDFESIFSRLEF